MNWLARLLPFLRWYPMDAASIHADIVAGITVALVLIPQSMAYAQLAGMPAYYGLYSAFLPVIVGALWGSSLQLSTGPVAMISLLTVSVLTPLAAVGSEHYIVLAIALTFLVGCIQFGLGVLRLGLIINFLSHPVVSAFTTAAAIIIGLSQLNKMLGVPIGRSNSLLVDVWGVLLQIADTHLPTLAFGVVTMALIWLMRTYAPKLPGVLIAVVAATALSWATEYERVSIATIEQVEDAEVRDLAKAYLSTRLHAQLLAAAHATKNAELRRVEREAAKGGVQALVLAYQINLITLQMNDAEKENRNRARYLRTFSFERSSGADANTVFKLQGASPVKNDGRRWRIRSVDEQGVRFSGGGEVVGAIPAGLPAFTAPRLDFDTLASLLSTAVVIALVGFMEAISMAKSIAAKTRQRLDPNQELIGQGLANLAGSFTQCCPVSGSFSRTAVNLSAGARTGMASIVTALIVMLTLFFFTPLLYHLPQSVLAAVIMLAVGSLVNFRAIHTFWRAQHHDGITAIVTFCATLLVAPHLDLGILIGASLAILLYLYRSMRPRLAVLGRHPDGTLRDAAQYSLPLSEHLAALRFDGQLYFANVPYFEDCVLEVVSRFPKARHILVVANGINQIDASGDETIRRLVEHLRDIGITLVFSGMKTQVKDVLAATGTLDVIGEVNIFVHEDKALLSLIERIDDPAFAAATCPLRPTQTV
jgi:SulP family sulfate permease